MRKDVLLKVLVKLSDMRKYYEVALKTYANTPTAKEDFDLETLVFDDSSDNYRQCVKIAKKHSMHIGERCLANNTEVLAQVTVICYIMDDTSDYEVQWQEEYVNGEKTRRY